MTQDWKEQFDKDFYYFEDGRRIYPTKGELFDFISQAISEAVAAREKEFLEMIGQDQVWEAAFPDIIEANKLRAELRSKLTASHARKEEGK